MIIDNESEPGAWERELRARGTNRPLTVWKCARCGWMGTCVSITDASSERELPDGRVEIDRTHLAICPRCFEYVQRSEVRYGCAHEQRVETTTVEQEHRTYVCTRCGHEQRAETTTVEQEP